MERGFTLNGQHCSILGVVMASKVLPVLAAPNDAYLQVPGRDGSYMFPRELVDGIIPIECGLLKANTVDLMITKRQISAWVYSKQKVRLIFDDEPDKFYWVKYDGVVGLDKMKTPGMGKFTLIFRCDPYAYSTVATSSALAVNNLGTAPVFPIITATFTATATEYKVLLGAPYVRVVRNFSIGDVLVIDMALSKVTVNGLRVMDKLDLGSRFFSIPAGASVISPSPVGVATPAVSYNARWL